MATLRLAFICTGNICRSPMAAALAGDLLKQRERPAVIISAGTLNLVGKPADRHAIAALEEIGISLDGHRSQGVNNPLVRMADHLIVMAPRHATELIKAHPALKPKIVRLWQHHPTVIEQIDDPIGQDLDAFRECRDVITRCLNGWIDTL